MTDQDLTVPLEALKSRYGIDITTVTSRRSGFDGQEEIAEITKLVLSGLSGAILAKIGEDFWILVKRVAAALFKKKGANPRRFLTIEIHVSDPEKPSSYEVTTSSDQSTARVDAFRRAVTEQIVAEGWNAGTKYRLSDGGLWIPERSDKE